MVNMMDVTNSQALSKITTNLLIKSEESLKNIREGMRSLFNNPDLSSGVVIFEDGKLSKVHDNEMRSIILGNQNSMKCDIDLCSFSLDKLIDHNEPLIVPDINKFHSRSKSILSQSLALPPPLPGRVAQVL